jgi:hypothetical protein
MMVAESVDHIRGAGVIDALRSVTRTSPDVRVFNLSFGDRRPCPGTRGGHHSYPLLDRWFDVSQDKLRERSLKLVDDWWLLELSYSEEAEYYPGITFTPEQRVGLAVELLDRSEQGRTSPQPMVQALPEAVMMVRLSAAVPVVNPVMVRSGRT